MKFEDVSIEIKPGTLKNIIVEKQEINISPEYQKKMRIRKKIQELKEDGFDIYSMMAGISRAVYDMSNGKSNSIDIQKFKNSFEAIEKIKANTK
jgi:hypothetical protein